MIHLVNTDRCWISNFTWVFTVPPFFLNNIYFQRKCSSSHFLPVLLVELENWQSNDQKGVFQLRLNSLESFLCFLAFLSVSMLTQYFENRKLNDGSHRLHESLNNEDKTRWGTRSHRALFASLINTVSWVGHFSPSPPFSTIWLI